MVVWFYPGSGGARYKLFLSLIRQQKLALYPPPHTLKILQSQSELYRHDNMSKRLKGALSNKMLVKGRESINPLKSCKSAEVKQSRPVSTDWTPSPYLPRHQVYLASKEGVPVRAHGLATTSQAGRLGWVPRVPST